MKSKKIIAMIVAFAAFMAIATSGFAAVTTTTTYNNIADKVVVDVDVTDATPDSEVTYLVKSNNQIVYIDQKTADENGAVGFDYKIAKSKISDLTTSVQFGTNGAAITGDDTAIELNNLSVTKNESTVTLYSDTECSKIIDGTVVVGDGDKIYAKVEPNDGFEIVTVTIGGVDKGVAASYEIVGNQSIVVTTQEKVVTPGYEVPEDVVIATEKGTEVVNGETVAVQKVTKVLKVVGTPKEVGVEYNGVKYPALNMGGETNYNTADGLCAVRIIEVDGTVVELTPYVITE